MDIAFPFKGSLQGNTTLKPELQPFFSKGLSDEGCPNKQQPRARPEGFNF